MKRLGIAGAGKLGTAVARAAVEAGYNVSITARDLEGTRLIAEIMIPGAHVAPLADVVSTGLVVLAVPLLRVRDLPAAAFDGVVIVDAVNWWEPVDGAIDRFGVTAADTSRLVQEHFPGARVVKALNQLGYHDVEDGRRPPGASDRLGVAVAGDDAEVVRIVAELVDRLGFDPVIAGSLEQGQSLGPGGPAFGVAMTAGELKRALSLV